MSAVTIRNLDETVKARLRLRAAQHGVSMEEEMRRILRAAVALDTSALALGERLKQRFAQAASAEFTLPARHAPRTPPAWADTP